MTEELTQEEREALEGFEDPKLQFYRVTMNLRGDVLDWLKEQSKTRTDDRGHKVGYQNVIQEELIKLMERDAFVKNKLKNNESLQRAIKMLEGINISRIVAESEELKEA